MQINKNPSTGRVPLGEADTNSAHCTLREGALAAAAVAQKTPRSVAKPPPIARSAAPPPAPPPMPAKGSLFAGRPSQLTPTWLHDIPGHGCPLPHAHPQGLQPRSSSAVTMGNGHSANQQDPNSLNPDACGAGVLQSSDLQLSCLMVLGVPSNAVVPSVRTGAGGAVGALVKAPPPKPLPVPGSRIPAAPVKPVRRLPEHPPASLLACAWYLASILVPFSRCCADQPLCRRGPHHEMQRTPQSSAAPE